MVLGQIKMTGGPCGRSRTSRQFAFVSGVDAVDGSSVRQQTSVINVIRAHLAEFGIVAPVGRKGVEQLLSVVADAGDSCPASQGSARQRLTQKRLSGTSIVASREQ